MSQDIAHLRKSYERAELSEDASRADPTEQFAQLIQSERRRYEKLVREANIKPD